MSFITGLIIGLVVGACFGALFMACCAVAGRSDDLHEQSMRSDQVSDQKD